MSGSWIEKKTLLNIKSKLKAPSIAMILTILWSTYRKHRHFHDETNKYFSTFENTFVESDQLKILQAHVNSKNSGYVTPHQNQGSWARRKIYTLKTARGFLRYILWFMWLIKHIKQNYLIPKRGLKQATNYRISKMNYVKPQSTQARNGPKKPLTFL